MGFGAWPARGDEVAEEGTWLGGSHETRYKNGGTKQKAAGRKNGVGDYTTASFSSGGMSW